MLIKYQRGLNTSNANKVHAHYIPLYRNNNRIQICETNYCSSCILLNQTTKPTTITTIILTYTKQYQPATQPGKTLNKGKIYLEVDQVQGNWY